MAPVDLCPSKCWYLNRLLLGDNSVKAAGMDALEREDQLSGQRLAVSIFGSWRD